MLRRGVVAVPSDMLENRLRKRFRHLGKWARRHDITCFRVYDRDIPEIPLTVDWYEGEAVVSKYERFAQDQAWLDGMVGAIQNALDLPKERLFVKHRGRKRGSSQYERLAKTGRTRIVGEGPHRFIVNLTDYLDTGLFLDHRATRALVASEVAGRRFLNLFCYTASFSVYAARAGAKSSTSVDMSTTYTAWAEKNLELNENDSRLHQVVCEEAGAFLQRAAARGQRWDVAVLDPPTFSNSKKMARELDLERDHLQLLRDVSAVLTPGGLLFFSTNKRRFQLDEPALLADGWTIADWTEKSTPPDFRKRPHRLWRLTVPDTKTSAARRR